MPQAQKIPLIQKIIAYCSKKLAVRSIPTKHTGTARRVRKAKDLCMQLRNAWKDFPDKVEMMKELLTLIGRDEVEVIA